MKCKLCKSEGSLDLEMDSLKAYDAASSGQFSPLIVVEARGWEPTEWKLTAGFKAEGEESGTVFEDIDLTELEWCEYAILI